MTAQDIFDIGIKRLKTFDGNVLLNALRGANAGAIEDVLNTNGNAYYQWITCLVEKIKPTQIVELGGAMGVWDLCVLHSLPEASKLYSITLAEHGLEFSYIVDTYLNFIPTVGDDLDLNYWPEDLYFGKTDLWFFDTLHTVEQLTKELDLYSPFFKKEAIILFDDIHSFGLDEVWEKVCKGGWGITDTFDATDPLHYTGYGIATL